MRPLSSALTPPIPLHSPLILIQPFGHLSVSVTCHAPAALFLDCSPSSSSSHGQSRLNIFASAYVTTSFLMSPWTTQPKLPFRGAYHLPCLIFFMAPPFPHFFLICLMSLDLRIRSCRDRLHVIHRLSTLPRVVSGMR